HIYGPASHLGWVLSPNIDRVNTDFSWRILVPSFEYMHCPVRTAAHHTSPHVISLFIDGLIARPVADSGWIGSDDIPYGFTTHVGSGIRAMLDEHLLVCRTNPNTFKSVPRCP
ncbi:hypothetical protein GGP41_001648, partial [Bipolaris sorokiniana]